MSGARDKGQNTTGKKTSGELFPNLMEKVLCGMGKLLREDEKNGAVSQLFSHIRFTRYIDVRTDLYTVDS